MPAVDRPFNAADRLKDYTDVKTRVGLFYAAHPEGALVTEAAWVSVDDDVPRIWVRAAAYRTPDDPHPGIGHSWMVLPGTTPYTKGSELENTETSAWGRAIVALGIGIGAGIASVDEIAAKEGQTDRPPPDRPELERRADGLIGTVVRGAPPADLELRYEPDGAGYWGFKLKAGKVGYQAFATGPLAEALATATDVEPIDGVSVTVWGRIEMVPWRKGDRDMPPYARIIIERLSTPEWTLPAVVDTIPLFPDEDEAKAIIEAEHAEAASA
jgi:hypothetical protein